MNRVTGEQILSFNQADESGLNDFHKADNPMKVAIDKVGINRYRVPISYKYRDGQVRQHDGEASLYVRCPAESSGINMSRLCGILTDELEKEPAGYGLFKTVLGRLRRDMRDHEDDSLFSSAFVKLKFKIALKQPSLKSGNEGWQYYDCAIEGRENHEGHIKMFLNLIYEYSSACPCSLSMSKQYEKDYREGKTTEGNGIAVAHSQRSGAKVTVEYDINQDFYIEDLVDLLRQAIPTETQSLVKRVDEQAFAVLNGQNPIFVEHAARRLSFTLNRDKRILDWLARVEHWESLHSHNAAAVIRKGVPGGLI